MTAQEWLQAFTQIHPLPAKYLVVDVETSGRKAGRHVVTQLACLLADRGKIVCQLCAIFDWPSSGLVNVDSLANDLAFTRRQVEAPREGGGPQRQYRMTLERMRREGYRPQEQVPELEKLFYDCRKGGTAFVGHCATMLDVRFLEDLFASLATGFTFAPGELFDTGALEKASQLGELPRPGEDLAAFNRRLCYKQQKGLHFSLDAHCCTKYQLDRKAGVDVAAAHEADVDCLLTYHLMETYRGLLGAQRGAPSRA